MSADSNTRIPGEPCECGRPTSVCKFSCDFCTGGSASSTPNGLRSDVGMALDKSILGLLGIIDMLTAPQMGNRDFYVGHGSIQSAHGICRELAETVETLMRARRLA